MNEVWARWPDRWEAALCACEGLGGDAHELIIEPPASEAEVEAVEEELGYWLPESFRIVLLGFSSRVQVEWSLPEDLMYERPSLRERSLPEDQEPPKPLREIFRGECCWNLNSLIRMEETRRGWIEACFPSLNDPEDAVWHDKLSFVEVGDGDQLAINTGKHGDPFVAILSHELGGGHGCRLGRLRRFYGPFVAARLSRSRGRIISPFR